MKLTVFLMIVTIVSMVNSKHVYSNKSMPMLKCPQVKQPKCPQLKKINPKPKFKTLRYQPLQVYNIDKNFCKCIDPTGKIIFTNMRYLKEQVSNCMKTELNFTETPCD